LDENVRTNGLSQVRCEAVALSDREGTGRLAVPDYSERHNSGVASLAEAGAAVEVPARTLDSYALERCALIKLDVEGWERPVLEGAAQTLERCRPLLYAECNSVENAWRLVTFASEGFEAWLHSPEAFNRNNYRRVAENRFGIARETNLLFVPRERAAELRPLLEKEEGLVPVPTLDALATAFLGTTRYGETLHGPERAQVLGRRVAELERALTEARARPKAAAPRAAPVLRRKLSVIVPVYNGLSDFQQLAHSLFTAHPEPAELLRFVFINDASPDPRVAEFLSGPLFDRPDVTRLTNEHNLGFIGTVNRGLSLCASGPEGTDVVLLNSDTQVHGNVFAILQDVADRHPNVASVTPLTNNGTIASLWNWPTGVDLFPGVGPETVARAVELARVEAAPVDAPTGIGFCMYMTKRAIDAVGGLDPVFGKGYGEENHWCQTAAKKGFVNLLTTEAFVYHHGSVSFGDALKQRQLERNLTLLADFHPSYHSDVQRYLELDPHRPERLQVQWAVRRVQKAAARLHTVLFVLHTDPAYFGGGTERHVMALTHALLASGRTEVLHLFPDDHRRLVLHAYLPGVGGSAPSRYIEERFEAASGFALLETIAPDVDTLHVHHSLKWPSWFMQVPALFPKARKLLTLHDYYAGCPSIRMMAGGSFCGIPSDLHQCNDCLVREHGFREMPMEAWRGTHARFMAQFDRVLVPSEATRSTLLRAFETVAAPGGGAWSKVLGPRIDVVPNFLFRPRTEAGETHFGDIIPSALARPRVVYLGSFVEPKGGVMFAAASKELLRRDYALEVWGTLGLPLPEGVVHRAYASPDELRELAAAFPVSVVCIPAVWPETFSFTTYEAALDIGAPVVVGPTGNPPEVVREHGIGVVLEALSARALVAAVQQCVERRPQLVQRLDAFRAHARTLTVETYLGRVYADMAPPLEPPEGLTRRLPAPSQRRIVHVQPTLPPPPLRHKIVDETNAVLKTHLPGMHALGRWLVAKARREA
ncbi:MAG: FkbM family methyltransferase, partial [Myxococcaceae bacterium]|nr:FkbM family methyltransferase [Myxococcaceae bacterium]